MNAIVSIPQDAVIFHDNQLRTTSIKVAEAFGKLHKNVIQKLESLDCSPEFTSANFSADVQTVEAGQGAKRESKIYEMTKDGFMFLVMGFTGKKAAQIKEAFINAFNAMAAELSKKEGPQKALPLTPAQQHHIQARVSELAKIKGNSYQSIYSGIKFAFRVGTYKDVTQNQYPSLCKHLGTQPLEGEYLPEGGQQLAIADLPEVNVREQMLGWMSSSVPLDGDLLAQVEEKSVSLALDFHKIAREHIAKRIAYHCVTVTNGLNKQEALAEIKKVTIDNALTLRFHNKLNHIINMAQMAQSLNKQYLDEMTGISKLA